MSQKLDESRANKEGLEIRTAQEHSILKNQIVRHQASTKHPPPLPQPHNFQRPRRLPAQVIDKWTTEQLNV